ncbi:MAG: hypothetical protein JSS34_05075 [Proteobacteria bacterium]|nr:hypothetical protein [Pseudomonadota bacterium]
MTIKKMIKNALYICSVIIGMTVMPFQSFGNEDLEDVKGGKKCDSHQVKQCIGPTQEECSYTTHLTCSEF